MLASEPRRSGAARSLPRRSRTNVWRNCAGGGETSFLSETIEEELRCTWPSTSGGLNHAPIWAPPSPEAMRIRDDLGHPPFEVLAATSAPNVLRHRDSSARPPCGAAVAMAGFASNFATPPSPDPWVEADPLELGEVETPAGFYPAPRRGRLPTKAAHRWTASPSGLPAFPAGRVLAAAPRTQLTGANVFDLEQVPAKSFPVCPRRAT
jgi:hypothetical protein